ncbi:MAG TPA: hypothetical protein VGQ47_02365 [Candidatus Limnocylindrales bacterium]|jgi:hypothetical protein|nr:hypothetical protein [Candidatus Limnocylindrales bacterium]
MSARRAQAILVLVGAFWIIGGLWGAQYGGLSVPAIGWGLLHLIAAYGIRSGSSWAILLEALLGAGTIVLVGAFVLTVWGFASAEGGFDVGDLRSSWRHPRRTRTARNDAPRRSVSTRVNVVPVALLPVSA